MAQRHVGIALAHLGQTLVEHGGNARAAQFLAGLQLAEILEEVLVVLHLVGADAVGQVGQHRFGGQIAQGFVVGGGAGLDHAARDQFQRAVVFQFFICAHGAVLGKEAVECSLPGELGPDGFHIGAQGQTVLQFFRLPALLQPFGHLGVGRVVAHQIARVHVGAGLDEGSAGDQIEQVLVVAYARDVDAAEVDLADVPAHRLGRRGGGSGGGFHVVLLEKGRSAPTTVQGAGSQRDSLRTFCLKAM